MMHLLGIYLELPAWSRMLIAVGVLGLGIYMTIFGYRGRQVLRSETLPNGDSYPVETKRQHPYADMSFFVGIGTCAVGAMLFTACGTSDAEKHGYKF